MGFLLLIISYSLCTQKGGVKIKLKMGNDEGNVKEDSTEETSAPKEETVNTDNTTKEEETISKEDQKSEVDNQNTKEDKKNDVEKLRKVIKVDDTKQEVEKKQDNASDESVLDDDSRDGLEQKRAILQSIKDFDFQIKKNQEEITTIHQRLESVSKDLDDLVSLYEIVSEQMNPFVGLSKVTKKRIDALENFTKEVDDLKTRMGDLESFAEKAGVNLDEIRSQRDDKEDDKTVVKVPPEDSGNNQGWANGEVDIIIEKAFSSMTIDNEIDNVINEFIENLKL